MSSVIVPTETIILLGRSTGLRPPSIRDSDKGARFVLENKKQ
jgi:hypothetical protein